MQVNPSHSSLMESVSYPYPLIPTPPGDWQKSLHEMQAIRMAALHNIIIRSFNAIIYHAPNVTEADVPSFIKFCRAVADVVHEHHQTEEEVMFPYFEEKLGKGAMDANVSQHHEFMPHFDEWNEHCKKILAKEEAYEPAHFVSMLRKSTDTLSAHLVDEIPTLEASIMKSHFTDAELRELETRIGKKIQECISVWILPILFVSGDLSHNSWFPDEIPTPVIFFARHISTRFGGDMWKWGQSDRYSQLKDEFKPMYAAASG